MDQVKKFISSEELFSMIEDMLGHHRQAVFTVTGMSMWPFICHGRDRVVVEQYTGTVKVGDIVLLQTGYGNYLLHRVTNVSGEEIETTGDGNCFRDGWFLKSRIRARVCKIIRKGKEIDCHAGRWRLIACIWMGMFPIRKYLLWGLRAISKVIHKKKSKKLKQPD